MKIANYGFIPSNNANKFNTQANNIQPTIQPSQDSYQAKGSELAAKLLDDKMAEALGYSKPETKADTSLFDFEEIVANVLDFVGSAVRNAQAEGADDEKLQGMLNDARKGVQIGVDSAIDELKDTGIFTDEIEQGIEQSKEGIFKGLDELEDEIFNPQAASLFVSQAQYASLTNNAQYSFTTAEGDEVSIHFSDATVAQSASKYQQDGNTQSYASASAQSREVSFSMSVNGELNEQEQEAINELMADLQQVSETFFSGDFDQAFDQAQELSLGSEQLVAFSMDLRQTKTVAVAAIKGYEQYLPTPEKAISDQLAPLNDDLKGIFEKATTLDLQNQLSGILQWLNQDQQQIDKLLDYTKSMFEYLEQLTPLNEAGIAELE